jgi:hypothetical protein
MLIAPARATTPTSRRDRAGGSGARAPTAARRPRRRAERIAGALSLDARPDQRGEVVALSGSPACREFALGGVGRLMRGHCAPLNAMVPRRPSAIGKAVPKQSLIDKISDAAKRDAAKRDAAKRDAAKRDAATRYGAAGAARAAGGHCGARRRVMHCPWFRAPVLEVVHLLPYLLTNLLGSLVRKKGCSGSKRMQRFSTLALARARSHAMYLMAALTTSCRSRT